jgi:5-methylcytosine-specific restriction endonuclease McrA
MGSVMVKEEKNVSVSELLRKLHQRSGSRCEGYKLSLDCAVTLTADLEPLIYHIDGNPRNNEISNLVQLCPNCHSKVMEQLSEKRRKNYVKKVAERLDKSFFSNRHS